ncbi:MAG: hypothetical protein E6Q36_05360 [Chryseobacterium sp.]|nr:MAG: hypothetical protein E6Q36_05360 [Chryseobacterium sp.]
MTEIVNKFFEKASEKFSCMKQLPEYGGISTTYIACPRDVKTFDEMKAIMLGLSPSGTIQSSGNLHVLNFDANTKVVIIYASDMSEFDWLYEYHSYSSSIILGKIFKRFNLKYSEKGLQYIEYSLNEHSRGEIGSIDLTRNMAVIMSILGLDYKVFQKGFKNLGEFFDFVIECPYLSTEKFISSDREYTNFTMQEFEKYLILNKINKKNALRLEIEDLKVKFPGVDFDSMISSLKERANNLKNIGDKFNGKVIMRSIPDIDKKKLGDSMRDFKFSFENKSAFEEFILNNSEEQIINQFKKVLA